MTDTTVKFCPYCRCERLRTILNGLDASLYCPNCHTIIVLYMIADPSTGRVMLYHLAQPVAHHLFQREGNT